MEEGSKEVVAVEGVSVVETWIRKHAALLSAATKHPFILSIRDGSVDLNSFKRWLGQDYLFVREFAPFVASVLLKASKESDTSDIETILGGLAFLNDEIAWFKKEASKWGVELTSVLPQKAHLDYRRFLHRLMIPEVGYTVAITAYWAIETVYQESFAHCLEDGSKTPEELKEACQRWGNDKFGQFCHSLQSIANCRLEKATDDVRAEAEVVLISVLEHEIAFWNMSHGGA